MSKVRMKWWLGAALLLCLVPSSIAVERGHYNHEKSGSSAYRRQVPEGGSAAIYLLGAGITCFGAMYIRSRVSKRGLS